MRPPCIFGGVVVLVLSLGAPALAENGHVEQVTVHSHALEGNLLGDSPERAVSIYLPPGYDRDTQTRYPVLYLLHGFRATNTMWLGQGYVPGLNAPAVADRLIDSGRIQPMILVMPDAYNKYEGSFYTNSSVSGKWEDFITKELVTYIDTHFRTLAHPSSRAIAGHSMGGYGALVLAMKYPDTFGVVYAMSPAYDYANPGTVEDLSPGAFDMTLGWLKMGLMTEDFTEAKQLAWAAAFSPDPAKPPYYVDLPYKDAAASPYRTSKTPPQKVDAVWQEWLAHSPLAIAHDFGMNLLLYQGVAFDIGSNDDRALVEGAIALDHTLTSAGIPHHFEEYQGDHTNKVTARFASVVLPFVSDHIEGHQTLARTSTPAMP